MINKRNLKKKHILKNPQKHVFKILLAVVVSVVMLTKTGTIIFNSNLPYMVNAEGEDGDGYTEEQKNAAKAWLSAHGYPPTRAGAAMAYQDYLNGKFDDDPAVRKYKGLDKEDSNKDSGNQNNTNTSDNGSDSTEASEDNDSGEDTSGGGTVAKNDSSDEDVNVMEVIDMMQEKHELTAADLGEQIFNNKPKYLLDKSPYIQLIYEPEVVEKKSSDSGVMIYILIGVVVVMLLASTALLFRKTGEQ